MEKQHKTFLSYSRVNKDFAIRLARELKADGFDVWLDQLDIPAGSRWDREVETALEECEIFMIILTPASITSENVLDEIGYAIDNNKRIFPVLLENCKIPLRLRRFQYVDFTNKDFDDGVESAKALLGSLINQPTSPRREVPPILDSTIKDERVVQVEAKVAPVPVTPKQKKQISKLIVYSVVAVIALTAVGIVFSVLTNANKNAPAPTSTSQTEVTNTATEEPIVTQEKTIVGQWIRRSTDMTEYLSLDINGSFHIEARNNESDSVIASADGTYTYDETNIYWDSPDFTVTESYYLDNGGELLIINNLVDKSWTRVE